MTEQEKKYVIEALEYALYNCIDVGGNPETHYNTLTNAIEVVKNCSIPDVANRRELLLSYSEWWDKNYSPLRLDIHRQKDIDEFLSQ